MNQNEIYANLEAIAKHHNFIEDASKLTEEWAKAPDGFDAVDPIFRFIEQNSDVDLGMPGPLVHFLENFYHKGYEQKLVDSINRKPTVHTVWMLNRVINGTNDMDEKKRLTEALKSVMTHPFADLGTQTLVARFISRLENLKNQ